jgi:hypothetical protein
MQNDEWKMKGGRREREDGKQGENSHSVGQSDNREDNWVAFGGMGWERER